jgi:hypothetical protein
MRFTMGGREFELTADEVRLRLKKVDPEPFQKYVVEVDEKLFPPKQVIDVCVGFARTSFTTMEAQRVLKRLGFDCRPGGARRGGAKPWRSPDSGESGDGDPVAAEIESLRAALTTVHVAVAALNERVAALETAGARSAGVARA